MNRQTTTDIDNPSTWIKYHKKLCNQCKGSCCSLEVEVKAEDLERMGVLDRAEYRQPLRQEAKRLKRQQVIERFHERSGTFTLARMANGDCIYLDQLSRRCTIYQQRPDTCRNHPSIGPRSGFCAFLPRAN